MNKILISFLIIALFVLAACQTQQAATGGQEQSTINVDRKPTGQASYKIGVMLPLTGDGAVYGLPLQKAIKTAFDEVNAQGGANGAKLEPIYEDSKCNPKDGNAAAQKLINIDKVKVILGGACSGETLGAAPIANDNKVVMISPTATSPDITNAGDFIFRLAPSDAFAGIVAAEYAYKELNAGKAAVISEATDYAQGLRKVFKASFAEQGGEIVADETYNPEDTDFRTQVTKAKAANPDVIYLVPQTTPKGVLLVKQVKEAGLTQQLLTAEVLLGRNVIAENAADMEGMIGIEQKFDDNAPKAAALLAKYEQQAGEKAPFPAFMSAAYDIVYLVDDAIETKGYDGEKIRDYFYAVQDYDGAVGKVSIDKNGDVILDFSVKQARNGGLVTLK